MKYQYDVCLSFASEQVSYVELVYEKLKRNNIKVFFDRSSDIETELWGSNLLEHFYNVYKKQSQYCVMFISKEYANKAWTRFERRSALERAFEEDEIYILPVRFDKTELPGFHKVTKYINANEKSPEELGNIIINKIKNNNTNETETNFSLSSIVDIINAYCAKTNSSFVTKIDSSNRLLLFRNAEDMGNYQYLAIIEKKSNIDFSVFNFGLFPQKELSFSLKYDELLFLIQEGLYGNEQ